MAEFLRFGVIGALCLAIAACNAGGRPKNAPKAVEPVAARAAVDPSTFGQVVGNAYIVAPGDTLAVVSDRTNTPIRSLIDMNNLQPPYGLAPGTRLALKPGAGDMIAEAPPPATPTGSVAAAPLPSGSTGSTGTVGTGTTTVPKSSPSVSAEALPPPPGSASAAPSAPTPLTPKPVAPLPAPAAQAPAKPQSDTQTAALPAPAPAPVPAPTVKTPATPAPVPTTAAPASAAPKATDAETESATAEAVAAAEAEMEKAPSAGSGKGPFVWPVQGKVIGAFGSSKDGLKNDGINIAAPAGAPVLASADGVVAYAGNELRGFGNMILIRHDGGFVTAYAHNASLLVKKGDKVKRGQTIARVGSTGAVFGPQLHFEIRKGTQPVDPMGYLGG